MEELKKRALENHIPIVRDKTALSLIEECKKKNPKKILEIGTAIGYSTLLMLKNSNAFVVTCEKDDERVKQARENIKAYGFEERVQIEHNDALCVLENLAKGGDKFDFIFLDGAKGQYIRYYPFLKQLLEIDGIMFTDNIDLNGLIASPERVTHKNRTMFRNMNLFLEKIENDNDFETEIFHIDDGFLISRKLH